MLKRHNRDVSPQPVLPMVEELKTNVVQSTAVPSGSGEFTPGGPWIFVQARQYHWHSVTTADTGTETQEHLVALEQKVFAFR